MEPNQNPLTTLAQQSLGQLPAVFQDRIGKGKLNADLAAGITAGFPILSFRGKAWRVKRSGEEKIMVNPDGTPKYAIEVVILKTSPHISKVWYEAGYVEGSTAPPDCWSVDGKKPDAASPKLQNPTCAGCRWNAWGSSRTQGGSGKGKDCADSKRIAVAPLQDIDNEAGGGPLLLRIPPASLADLLNYANSLETIHYPYFGVGTQLSFDMNAEYPKLMFKPVRALTAEEAEKVIRWQDSPVVERILNTAVDEVTTDGTDTTHVAPTPVPAPTQRPVQAPQQAPAQQAPQTATVVTPVPAQPATVSPALVTPAGNVAPVDPHAERRAQLRSMNFDEPTIDGLLGPEPKAAAPAPEDPRIAQLRGLGFTEDQIKAALATTTPSAPAANGANGHGEAPRQGRGRPRKPKEAAGQAPAPEPTSAAPPLAQAAPAPAVAPQPAPQPAPKPAEEQARMAEFESLLDQLTKGDVPAGQS